MRTEAARGRRHAAYRYRSERAETTRHAAPLLPVEVVSSPPEALPTPIDRELLEDFIAECREHVQHMEVALLALETDPDDREAIDTAFRAFHTTKGTAAFLRLTRYCRPGASHRITPEPYARWRDTLHRGIR